MANIKSQIKRNKTNEKRRQANASFKSSYKTAVKAFKNAVTEENKDKSTKTLSLVHKKLDMGQAKGIFHKNFVARNKSAFDKLFNTLQ